MTRFAFIGATLAAACAAALLALAHGVADWRPRFAAPPTVAEVLAARPVRMWGSATRGAVLDIAPPPSWMSDAVGVPTVLLRDGRLWMFFGGVQATDDPYVARVRVGLAESVDGFTFRLAHRGQPVFSGGPPGAFDSHSANHPFVIERPSGSGGSGELWMYYAGADGSKGTNSARVEQLGLARSRDGITWHREAGPVIPRGAPGEFDSTQVASPAIVQRGSELQMWYGAYDGFHRIAYATSPDGVHWTKHGPVHGLRGAEHGELGPSVYFDGQRYLMFYNSVDPAEQEWKLYAATSDDGQNWTAAYGGAPVVDDAPSWTFARAGRGRNSAVHLSSLIVVRGRLLAYYMGEDEHSLQRMGVITFR